MRIAGVQRASQRMAEGRGTDGDQRVLAALSSNNPADLDAAIAANPAAKRQQPGKG
jgi:hypothetical protein